MDSPKALANHRGAKIALIAAAVILAVMALNTILHYWNIRRLAETRDLVLRSSEKLRAANQLLSALQDAETGQRGFLLTGDRPYLEPYVRSTSVIDSRYQKLQQLVAQDPAQQKSVAALGPP
jgi:CHASE3 domain sensor protein